MISDVLAGFISAMAHARRVADQQAVANALFYKRFPLLHGMPVPRMRFKSVNINLPVAINEVIPGTAAERTPLAELVQAAVNKLTAMAPDVIAEAKASLENAQRAANDAKTGAVAYLVETLQDLFHEEWLRRFADIFSRRLEYAAVAIDFGEDGKLSDESMLLRMGEALRKALRTILVECARSHIPAEGEDSAPTPESTAWRDRLRKIVNHECVEHMEHILEYFLWSYALRAQSVYPDFSVNVTTDAIRKKTQDNPDSVLRLNFTLHEEGLEWFVEKADDEDTPDIWRLVQE